MSESVKICDTELERLIAISNCWDEIENVLGRYVNILEKVSSEAIKAGHINMSINNLLQYSKRLYNCSVGWGTTASGNAQALLSKVEDLDLDLYKEV